MKTYALCSLPSFGMALSVCVCMSGCGAEQGAQDVSGLSGLSNFSNVSMHEVLTASHSPDVDADADADAPALLARVGLSRDDRLYLQALAASHAYQGQMGNLVAAHTHNPDTREFGRFLVETHQDVRQRLDTLASRYNIALPARLTCKQSYRLHKLSCCVWFFEKSFFEYEYKALATLRAQSRRVLARSANPEVQAWARDTLATIELTIRMSAAGHAVFDGPALGTFAEALADGSDDADDSDGDVSRDGDGNAGNGCTQAADDTLAEALVEN